MLSKRSSFGAAVLNGKLYVCGGTDNHWEIPRVTPPPKKRGFSILLTSAERYDPSTNVWEVRVTHVHEKGGHSARVSPLNHAPSSRYS
jgi:hypothetical protein